MDKQENLKFVTIELSKKQVDTEHPYPNSKNGKTYFRVFAPEGGVFFYPAESLKVKKDNKDRVFFTRPEGTELQVQYSKRIAGVLDDAPNEDKYENTTKIIKIEDLKQMYEDERKAYAERTGFVNMTVPTEWGDHFVSGDKRFVSISIPIPTQSNPNGEYYSFILPEERFKASSREDGMSYFGFPKKKKDDENEDYMISLKGNRKQEDGSYQDVFMDLPSLKLKEYVDAARERSNVKDLFVNVDISEKLLRHFESGAGKELIAVSVPVFDQTEKKDFFYEIVVPTERVHNIQNSSNVHLSLFKNGSDGEAYTFNAKRSVKNAQDQYEDIILKMTSEEVVRNFQESMQRYREAHQGNTADYSLADEMNDNHHENEQENSNGTPSAENNQNVTNNAFRHRGR